MNTKMANSIRSPRVLTGTLLGLLLSALTAAFVLAAGARTSGVSAQELGKLNRFLQGANQKDDAMQIFRRGRDLVEEGNWSRAATTFNSFVADFPKHKDVDAALYWLAFSLKKQGRLVEADRHLERLLREHPRSSWADDARAMRVELAGQTGNKQVIDNELDKNDAEIKMIALQSLFQSNPDRAIELATNMLKSDAKTGKQLKEAAIALLGQHGGAKSASLLMELARVQTDAKVRSMAIFWLGQRDDDSVVDNLMTLYGSEQSLDVKKQILFALSQSSNVKARAKLTEIARAGGDIELRKQAVFGLSQTHGETSVNDLIAIFDSGTDKELRNQVLFALGQMHNERAAAKLLEVARTPGELEPRKQAIFWLGQQGNGRGIETLVQMYDGEQSNEIKDQLLFAFGQSHEKAALQKLMQVAKRDSSVEARKKALFWLGQSKDPEAVKFIEDILK